MHIFKVMKGDRSLQLNRRREKILQVVLVYMKRSGEIAGYPVCTKKYSSG